MKLSTFLTLVLFLTLVALLYVYQQTEVFRLAYVGQKKQLLFSDLLDKNTLLRYNMNRNASLIHLGNKVSSSSDYEIPDSYRLVRMSVSDEALRQKAKSINRQNLLSNIFGVKAQAEANTISP